MNGTSKQTLPFSVLKVSSFKITLKYMEIIQRVSILYLVNEQPFTAFLPSGECISALKLEIFQGE